MPVAKILGVGVATMDVYTIQRRMYPGGNEYNVACNAAFLGAEAGFLGVFADDKAGEILEQTLINCGVNTAYSHHEHGSSGYSLVELKEDGDRIFLDWNKQGVTDLYPIQFTQEELAYVKTYDVVSLGRCASVPTDRIQFLHEQGVNICYDFHATYGIEELRTFAPLARFAFFSASHLTEEELHATLKTAVDLGVRIAVGTRGVDPVVAYDGTNWYTQETCRVRATDALGAGDSYIGAFLTHYLNFSKDLEMDEKDRIQRALALAARHSAHVVQIEGSIGVGYDVDPEKISEIINL